MADIAPMHGRPIDRNEIPAAKREQPRNDEAHAHANSVRYAPVQMMEMGGGRAGLTATVFRFTPRMGIGDGSRRTNAACEEAAGNTGFVIPARHAAQGSPAHLQGILPAGGCGSCLEAQEIRISMAVMDMVMTGAGRG